MTSISSEKNVVTTDPVLRVYILIPGFMALGAVGLMILKLDWVGSIVVMVMALVVSLIGGATVTRGTRNIAQDEKERAGYATEK